MMWPVKRFFFSLDLTLMPRRLLTTVPKHLTGGIHEFIFVEAFPNTSFIVIIARKVFLY
jgi:hypothetical protein